MTTERDVIEFIIVPPYERRVAVAAAKERFEHYLGNRFPGLTFKVAAFAPVGDEDEFCIVPIMNFLDDEGRSRMCVEPKRWVLQDIAQACKEFDLHGLRHFAA
ncbi:hypothetical protein ASC97_07240 [Rhizobium sp. Root1203]|uniref:hypothetical protein n=1 Tax=Rhizobium sp. Root1203 TaxID=1736427 RepID=UPI00070F78F3|nr:hypothetical protein [Rhizobium sp. Root1203]KQV28134.1 hypothetical protein ASC97_07240 [Rhizobium sp. Root1203]